MGNRWSKKSINHDSRAPCVEALKNDAKDGTAYFNLGVKLSAPESIVLGDGRSMTKRDLFIEALKNDAKYSAAYFNLGYELSATESIVLSDGRSMTKRDLYVEALKHDAKDSAAYVSLGNELSATESIVLSDGRSMTKRELYVEALKHDARNSAAYINLGNELSATEAIVLGDGRSMTRLVLFTEGVECNPSDPYPWYSLSQTLSEGESIEVSANGQRRTVSRTQCLIEAYSLNPSGALSSAVQYRCQQIEVRFTSSRPSSTQFSCNIATRCDDVFQAFSIPTDAHVEVDGTALVLRRGTTLAACGFSQGEFILAWSFDPTVCPPISAKDVCLVECIGEGGFGEVWRGTYREEIVAVKMPRVRKGRDKEYQSGAKELEREIDIMRFVKPHPHIVRFLGKATSANGQDAWAVMEFVDGSSLQSLLINRSPLSLIDVVRIALELCDALQHLHQHRVFHLDVTPNNVLLTREGRCIKLCDFGLSRENSNQKSSPMTHEKGTPHYAAPEQFDGERGTLSAHTDVYGFGATMYFVITGGQQPWSGLTLVQIVTQMLRENPCPPPTVNEAYTAVEGSAAFAPLVARCMALNPSQRPTLDRVKEELLVLSATCQQS